MYRLINLNIKSISKKKIFNLLIIYPLNIRPVPSRLIKIHEKQKYIPFYREKKKNKKQGNKTHTNCAQNFLM